MGERQKSERYIFLSSVSASEEGQEIKKHIKFKIEIAREEEMWSRDGVKGWRPYNREGKSEKNNFNVNLFLNQSISSYPFGFFTCMYVKSFSLQILKKKKKHTIYFFFVNKLFFSPLWFYALCLAISLSLSLTHTHSRLPAFLGPFRELSLSGMNCMSCLCLSGEVWDSIDFFFLPGYSY